MSYKKSRTFSPNHIAHGALGGYRSDLNDYIQSKQPHPPLIDFRNSALGFSGIALHRPSLAQDIIAQTLPAPIVPATTARNQAEARTDARKPEHSVGEEAYYKSFAAWLTDGIGEANVAEPIGGSTLRGKWGTPDVLGVRKPLSSDPIKFETEIVAAEIKLDPNQPIVAFGQATAYCLFAHKSYVAMPETITADDLGRLEALSMLHGIGLVTFSLDPSAPNFTLKVRARSGRPNLAYMNQMARRMREVLPHVYDRMF